MEADQVADVDDPVGRIAQHVHHHPVVAVHMGDADVLHGHDDDVLVHHPIQLHPGAQGQRHRGGIAVRVHGQSRHPLHGPGGAGDEVRDRSLHGAAPAEHDSRAALPGEHDGAEHPGDHQRQPAAGGDLHDVRGQQHQLEAADDRAQQHHLPQRPAQDPPRVQQEQREDQDDRGGHREAVGGGERLGATEDEHQ
eukprot:Nk52_evm1s1278 gene=Nk52_evmTU1s1278